jgi:hypothetical protein
MAQTKRRARGEDSIYYDRSRDRWAGTITVGWKPGGRRDRIIVRGRTKIEVKDKLRAKHTELAAGIRTPAHYTVELCLKDWLQTLSTQADSPVTGYRVMVRHLVELIGTIKLVELKERDVDFALGTLAERLSTRSVRLARMILIQARRQASAGTGRRASSAIPLFRSCRIPAYPSSRSWTRWATPALGQPRLYIGISSGQSRVPLLSRSVRCSRAEERPSEAKAEPLGSQFIYQDDEQTKIFRLMSSGNSGD